MEYFKNLSIENIIEKSGNTIVIEEEWRDIKNYEGLYMVSSVGRIKSLSNNKFKKDKILRAGKNHGGYLHISLSKNNVKSTQRISRIVATAFLENIENKPQVNHKNGIITDNRASELEWNTASENIKHSFSVLNRACPNFGGYDNSKKVKQIDPKTNKVIKIYDSAYAATLETKIRKVSSAATGMEGRKTAGGFKWEYV